MMSSGIYMIRNTINGKIYVGSAVSIRIRWKAHQACLLGKRHDNIYLQRAWDKYGPDVFIFSVLEYIQDKQNLIQKEQYWIDILDATGVNGYNICPTAGNCLGRRFNQDSLAKMSKSAMGKILSTETREKISIGQKLVLPEVRARIAAKHIGRKNTPETIAKMSAAKMGHQVSAVTRAKISASLKQRVSV